MYDVVAVVDEDILCTLQVRVDATQEVLNAAGKCRICTTYDIIHVAIRSLTANERRPSSSISSFMEFTDNRL